MRVLKLAVVMSLVSLVSCASTNKTPAPASAAKPATPVVWELAAVPAEHKAAVDRADVAMTALQTRLGARLLEVMGKDGPAAAMDVCRVDAPSLAQAVNTESGFPLGRTSHKLRNPENAPRAWVKEPLDAAAGQPVANVKPLVVDLGDSLGVLKPIGVLAPCIQCHGTTQQMAPGVADLLKAHYPQDAATGFAVGDFRGFFWAQVPKTAP
jgi:hypothetical protein